MGMMPVKGSYYINRGDVYKVTHVSRGTDEVYLLRLRDKREFVERYALFSTAYEQVFLVGDVASWLNRSPRSLRRYEDRGIIKKQNKYPTGGKREVRFYRLNDVFEIHEMISEVHQGRPRKDGRIINNTLPDIGTLKINLKERFVK